MMMVLFLLFSMYSKHNSFRLSNTLSLLLFNAFLLHDSLSLSFTLYSVQKFELCKRFKFKLKVVFVASPGVVGGAGLTSRRVGARRD
jgi:hypothetical protein